MKSILKRCGELLVLGLVICTVQQAACAQMTAVWSFENASPSMNTPTNLGDNPIEPFDVASDDGSLTATFRTLTLSTQFGIYDNVNNSPIADAPMAGNLLFGGRTAYELNGQYGPAAIEIVFSQPIIDIGFDFLDASMSPTYDGVAEALDVQLGPQISWTLMPQDQNSYGYDYQMHVDLYSVVTGQTFAPTNRVVFTVTPSDPNDSYVELGLDNLVVRYGSAPAAVPEPGPWALMVGAAGPLAWLFHRRSVRG